MSIHWNMERQTKNSQVGHDGNQIYILAGIDQWIGREEFEKSLDKTLKEMKKVGMAEYDKLVAEDTPA